MRQKSSLYCPAAAPVVSILQILFPLSRQFSALYTLLAYSLATLANVDVAVQLIDSFHLLSIFQLISLSTLRAAGISCPHGPFSFIES